MLMQPETALLVGIFAPLVTALLVPFLAVRSNWRDIAGPVGAIVTFLAALDVARAVLGGDTPTWTAVELAPGIDLGFRVTPLGAIFGLVASGLWILALANIWFGVAPAPLVDAAMRAAMQLTGGA